MDNNKVDFGALLRAYQDDLRATERERDDWRTQAESSATSSSMSPDLSAEVTALRAENKRLREERDTMARAFSLMGSTRQVDEQKKLLDRVQRLEDMVTLGAVFKPSASDRNERMDRRGSTRRLLLGELPLQMERLRSVSSRSIGSGGANRSVSNRSQSTAAMTEDILESPSVRSSRTSSPAPAGALSKINSSNLMSHNMAPPLLLGQGASLRTPSSDRRGVLGRQNSREDVMGDGGTPGRLRRGYE